MAKIEFVLSEALMGKSEKQKVDYILNAVKKEKILVFDSALNSKEERDLIEKTMEIIDERFPGIEVSTIGNGEASLKTTLIKMLGGKANGFTVIGPSSIVKQLKRDPDKLRLYAEI